MSWAFGLTRTPREPLNAPRIEVLFSPAPLSPSPTAAPSLLSRHCSQHRHSHPPTRARRPRPAPPAPAPHTAPSLLTRLLLPTLCSQPCSLSPSVRARDSWEQGVPLRRVRSVAPDNGGWSPTSVPSCLVYQTCGDVHARMEGAF